MRTISSTRPLRRVMAICLLFAANAAIPVVSGEARAQKKVDSQNNGAPVAAFSYSDFADFSAAASIIASAEITQAIPLKPAQAAGVPAGFRRVFISARTIALIRGEGGVSPILTYLADMPVDSRGKLPKLKKSRVMVFARPGAKPGEIQLIGSDAQIPWSPTSESTVRSIVSELLSAKSPPKILGLGDAFHVAGTVQGEGETQIFLRTDSGEPVSLSIVRRPGQETKWAVALGEIVDEAAAAPKAGTLLWYRLACGLPSALPPASVRTLAVTDAEAARADYQLVLDGLGPCGRTRAPR